MTDSTPATAASNTGPRTYMGMQLIVDVTSKTQEEIWTAIETALCGACDTGERDCTIESMASCTLTDDLEGVFAWLNNEEPNVQQPQAEATAEPASPEVDAAPEGASNS